MGAQLGQVAVGHHRHPVGPLGGRQAVGDEDHRPPLAQGQHRGLDQGLGARVQAGGGLVEHQHRRVGQGRPGQRHQLLLAGGEPRAPLPDLGVEAVGEGGEALGEPQAGHGRLDLGVGGLEAADPDVVANGSREQEPLLGHDHDAAPQRGRGGVAQVHPAEAHGARRRVVEPGHQLGQRRLARPGGPHQGQALTLGQGQGHVPQHLGLVLAVGEAHALDGEIAPVGQVDRTGALGHVDAGVEQAEQLGQRRPRRLQDVEELTELLDRLEEIGEGQHEEGDGAHRDRVVEHQPATDEDDGGGGAQPGELDDRQVPGLHLHRGHVGVVEGAVATTEVADLDLLAGEGLDDPHPGDALLEVGKGRADAVPHHQVGPVRVALEADARHHHEGHRHQAHQQQLPGDDGQGGEGEGQQQGVRHEHEQADLDQLLQRLDVGGHPRDHDAGLLAVVEGHGQPQQVGEHAVAEVLEERLADQADLQDHQPVDDIAHGGGDDVTDDGQVEGGGVALGQALVDGEAHEERPGEHRGRPHHEQQARHHDPAAVGAEHAEGPAQHPARLAGVEHVLLGDAGLTPHRQPPPSRGRRPRPAPRGSARWWPAAVRGCPRRPPGRRPPAPPGRPGPPSPAGGRSPPSSGPSSPRPGRRGSRAPWSGRPPRWRRRG